YGRGLVDMVRRAAPGRKLHILGRSLFHTGPKARAALVARLAKAHPPALLLAASDEGPVASFLNALHARSPRTRFFLGDALFDDAFAALLHAGAAAKTRIAAAPLAQSEYGARADHFYAGFRARFGHAPSRLAIYGYEAMSVILDSIARAASQGATR